MGFVCKKYIRDKFRKKKFMSAYERSEENSILCQNLHQLLKCLHINFLANLKYKREFFVALYYPIGSEPDLSRIMLDENWKILLPKISTDLNMVSYDFKKDQLVSSKFEHILEPQNEEIIIPDIIILPGVAFSVDGYRIGSGKALYDQYLGNILKNYPQLLLVGVCFHEYLIDYFIKDPWDVKLNYIVTNKMILKL